ncbi:MULTISPECIES: 2-keto-4-pentenoate hydratase [unclassified Kribbella]|uniref:2-keto-4-pentenoate hydratase n=1 Tax=unclassified Kribbella TaxID=2644121 RepID=UPI0030784D55
MTIHAAAERLRQATLTTTPCEPVRDLIGRDDVSTAYAVQKVIVDERLAAGGRVVGRKIGLTSPAVQQQLGVDRPDFGVLFADMEVANGGVVGAGVLLQPKIEAEVAFVLGRDLDGLIDDTTVRDAVEFVVPALEIVDSRIAGWDISFGDTVADNASSGLFVLGDARATLGEVEPIDVQMSLRLDGETASEGSGKACLGDPLLALAWLARTARELGEPLRAGQVILSGALGPMVAVTSGARVEAELSGLGRVAVSFS